MRTADGWTTENGAGQKSTRQIDKQTEESIVQGQFGRCQWFSKYSKIKLLDEQKPLTT